MNDKSSWIVGEAKNADGDIFFRFNYGMRQVTENPEYSKTIIFETVAADTSDIDEYLSSLDSIEDAIKNRMESLCSCIMLLTQSGAGFRDLHFAYGGNENAFDPPIRTLLANFPERMNVRVVDPDWTVFNKLVGQVKT